MYFILTIGGTDRRMRFGVSVFRRKIFIDTLKFQDTRSMFLPGEKTKRRGIKRKKKIEKETKEKPEHKKTSLKLVSKTNLNEIREKFILTIEEITQLIKEIDKVLHLFLRGSIVQVHHAHVSLPYEILSDPDVFLLLSALSENDKVTLDVSDDFYLELAVKFRFIPTVRLIFLIIKHIIAKLIKQTTKKLVQ